ncbi:MAG: hypothetical protein IBJ10_10595 [Phycisphaerales bacterium]|nr:hypothetical protein [Phycisphaerales bacterium]
MNERLMEIWTLAQQDRKKAATLGALLLVALVMGVRAIVSGSGGPSRAAAAPAARGMAAPTAGKPAGMTMEQTLAALRPQQRVSLVAGPPRDLFRSTWAVIGADADGVEGKSGAGGADNADGSGGVRERVEREAASLRLRSTMLGARPLAVIEGSAGGGARRRVARMGEELDGFRVVRIEAHLVELEKEGVRVAIEQSRPTP